MDKNTVPLLYRQGETVKAYIHQANSVEYVMKVLKVVRHGEAINCPHCGMHQTVRKQAAKSNHSYYLTTSKSNCCEPYQYWEIKKLFKVFNGSFDSMMNQLKQIRSNKS